MLRAPFSLEKTTYDSASGAGISRHGREGIFLSLTLSST
jgi:hypothetical protein